MKTSRNQHTVATPCVVSGRGYWSGKDVCVKILPARPDTGVILVRSDLPGKPSCPATADHAGAISFRTVLKQGNAQFAMVEHLMAALHGLEIDNCVVEISGEELPGFDGSSQAFVDALLSAGLIIQAAPRHHLQITQTLHIRQADSWVDVLPPLRAESYFEYQLSYGADSPIPSGHFGIDITPRRFARQVAAARTFVTLQQADLLQSQGVAAHVTKQDLLVFGPDGPVDNWLRFSDECARHKTLDLVGDLALVGVDLIGRVISHRGGHILNGKVATLLRAMAKKQLAARGDRSADTDTGGTTDRRAA